VKSPCAKCQLIKKKIPLHLRLSVLNGMQYINYISQLQKIHNHKLTLSDVLMK